MEATVKTNAALDASDGPIVRLRVAVYDRLAAAKGIKTVVAAAKLHGLNRTTLFEYRSGKGSPNLSTAMKIAADLDTTVDELFELRPEPTDV